MGWLLVPALVLGVLAVVALRARGRDADARRRAESVGQAAPPPHWMTRWWSAALLVAGAAILVFYAVLAHECATMTISFT